MSATNSGQWGVIVNLTAAGGAVKKQWPAIEAALKAGLPVADVWFTAYPKHAIELVEKAVEAGYRRLIAVGGDGTNHEVANGILMQQIVPSQEITYALLPVGTGNDWARMYGIPNALKYWVEMVQDEKTCFQDVGKVEYQEGRAQIGLRYFVNVAGMAYDAFVVQYAESRRSPRAGRFFYFLMILWCLFRYRHVKSAVQIGDSRLEDYFYTINIGICRYSGGGIQMTPHAVPDDGLLALTLAGCISKLGVLVATRRFYNGTISKHPKVNIFQSPMVVVEAAGDAPVLLEADGEFLGQAPVKFSVVGNALQIVVPSVR
jgi:YegS/Rv2252/BmrU family lipid kinase